MSSRLQKQAEKLLKKIEFEPAPLSTNKGIHIDDPNSRRLTRKDRKHSGHKIIYADDEDYPIMFDSYDSWNDYRDGIRNLYDRNKIYKIGYKRASCWRIENYNKIKKRNTELKKHEYIRQSKKDMKKLKCG